MANGARTINERCSECGCPLLITDTGNKYCSFVGCTYGLSGLGPMWKKIIGEGKMNYPTLRECVVGKPVEPCLSCEFKEEIKELEKMGKANSGKWIPVAKDYDGKGLELLDVRWKHVDGTLSPIGFGKMIHGDILVYWSEEDGE